MSLLAGSKGVQKEKGPKKPSGKEMFYGHMAGTEGGEADEEDGDDGKWCCWLGIKIGCVSPYLFITMIYIV